MKLAAIAVLLAAMVLPATLHARPVYLFGEIGKSSVLAVVDREGNALSGWYLYSAVGKELQLSGQSDASGAFHLDESVDAHKTGVFEGKFDGGALERRMAKRGGRRAARLLADRDARHIGRRNRRFSLRDTSSGRKAGPTDNR